MEIKPPPPLVSAYSVVELKVINDPATGIPYLSHQDSRNGRSGERYINTIDIKTQYMMKGLFIWGWQEFHYEVYYDNAGAPRFRETTVTRQHLENQERVVQLRDKWNEYYKHTSEAFAVPEMLSLEQELTTLGWQFEYIAGHGPAYHPDLEAEVNWAIKEGRSDKQRQDQGQLVLQPGEQYDLGTITLPVKEDGLNRIESKIDVLTSSISSLVEVLAKNANGHDSGTSQLRVSKPTPKHSKRDNKRLRPSTDTNRS